MNALEIMGVLFIIVAAFLGAVIIMVAITPAPWEAEVVTVRHWRSNLWGNGGWYETKELRP